MTINHSIFKLETSPLDLISLPNVSNILFLQLSSNSNQVPVIQEKPIFLRSNQPT